MFHDISNPRFHCPQCGSSLADSQTDGLCPLCLLTGAEQPEAPEDHGQATPRRASLFALAGYTVTNELARGGMGVVYRAVQHSPQREVALKMLLPFSASSSELRERFQLEARTLSELDHPAILPIYESGEFDGLPWFSMKLAAGGSLAERIAGFAGRWHDIAELMATLADAVQFAHDHGVLHRDLKPGNILFDAAVRPYVADFGLAKLVEQDADLTLTRRVLGTPHYLAPEVAAHNARHATTASDIYSLGAVLFELLAGRPPFGAEGLPALLRRIAEDEPDFRPPAGPTPGGSVSIPRDLEVITRKCLAKEPSRRYASARELAAELRRFLGGEPILARPATGPEKLANWCRRRPALAAALAVCGVSVLAGGGGVLWQLRQTELARAEAERQAAAARSQRAHAERARMEAVQSELRLREHLYAADMQGAFRAVEQADLGTARLLLEAHRPAPGQSELRGFEWRHLWARTRSASTHTLRIRDRDVSALELSPDGTRLAVGGGPYLHVYDVATRQLLGQTRVGGTQSITFSPDGRLIYVGSRAWQEVRVWDLLPVETPPRLFPTRGRWPNVVLSPRGDLLAVGSGGHIDAQPEGLTAVHDPRGALLHELPDSGGLAAFTPNGERLATGSWQGTIKLWQPATGAFLKVFTNTTRVVALRFTPDGRELFASSLNDGGWLFDLATAEQRPVARGHAGTVWDAAFSPDGRTLATVGTDQTVRLWDRETGEPIACLLGHSFTVSKVVWSPDGRRLITGGQDGTVRFWDFPSAARLPLDSPVVTPEHFSDDGRWWLSRQEDGRLALFEQPGARLVTSFTPQGQVLGFFPGGAERRGMEATGWKGT